MYSIMYDGYSMHNTVRIGIYRDIAHLFLCEIPQILAQTSLGKEYRHASGHQRVEQGLAGDAVAWRGGAVLGALEGHHLRCRIHHLYSYSKRHLIGYKC